MWQSARMHMEEGVLLKGMLDFYVMLMVQVLHWAPFYPRQGEQNIVMPFLCSRGIFMKQKAVSDQIE